MDSDKWPGRSRRKPSSDLQPGMRARMTKWLLILYKAKSQKTQTQLQANHAKIKKLVLCVPSVDIAPRYLRLYIVYIGPFFPTPCSQQLCPLVADSNLNCNASSRSAARQQAELSCNACSRSAARKQSELSDWTFAGRRNVHCHGRCRKLRARVWSGDETESKKQETRPFCLVVLPNNANLQAMIYDSFNRNDNWI